MRDLIEWFLYWKWSHLRSVNGIVQFAMVPMKLINNVFVSRENHDKLIWLIYKHMQNWCKNENLTFMDMKNMIRINNRWWPLPDVPHISMSAWEIWSWNELRITYFDWKESQAIASIKAPTITFLSGDFLWSRFVDCVCDYASVWESQNKCESLFSWIETLTNTIDTTFKPKSSTNKSGANTQYMIDNILLENNMIIIAGDQVTLRKKTREDKMQLRQKYLEKRAELLNTVYNNKDFIDSGSKPLDVSMKELLEK